MLLENYLTVAEAAEDLGLKHKTLLARINRGKVKAERRGRVILVHVEEVERIKRDA